MRDQLSEVLAKLHQILQDSVPLVSYHHRCLKGNQPYSQAGRYASVIAKSAEEGP